MIERLIVALLFFMVMIVGASMLYAFFTIGQTFTNLLLILGEQ